ncbi:Rv3235 family protein [Aeromicrobium sp. CF4.19]|uniref:Rv3235 family protein n=1 Tax=Aeromicrobium sp. CF4.19 TaxID=3373082 RepID=UPI003EE51052
MRTAVALSPRPRPQFELPLADAPGQAPLPFPGMQAVLPVSVDRSDTELAGRAMRQPVARFMQALTEVLSGERPVRQMAAWMTPTVHASLSSRLVARARAPRRGGTSAARLVSVHVAMVNDEAMEVAGRMVHRGRSRAVAVRLELLVNHRGRTHWTCTALEWA